MNIPRIILMIALSVNLILLAFIIIREIKELKRLRKLLKQAKELNRQIRKSAINSDQST
jgi:hypothetical protein